MKGSVWPRFEHSKDTGVADPLKRYSNIFDMLSNGLGVRIFIVQES